MTQWSICNNEREHKSCKPVHQRKAQHRTCSLQRATWSQHLVQHRIFSGAHVSLHFCDTTFLTRALMKMHFRDTTFYDKITHVSLHKLVLNDQAMWTLALPRFTRTWQRRHRRSTDMVKAMLGHNDYVLLNLWIFRTSSHSDWQLGGNWERFIGQQWMKSPLLQGASLQLWQSMTCQEGGCQLALSMCHHFGLPPHSWRLLRMWPMRSYFCWSTCALAWAISIWPQDTQDQWDTTHAMDETRTTRMVLLEPAQQIVKTSSRLTWEEQVVIK